MKALPCIIIHLHICVSIFSLCGCVCAYLSLSTCKWQHLTLGIKFAEEIDVVVWYVEQRSWLSQQGPKDPAVRPQTQMYILVTDTAEVETRAEIGLCENSLCLCYEMHSRHTSGNNSSVVCSNWNQWSGWKEEEGVEAMGAGGEAWPAACVK